MSDKRRRGATLTTGVDIWAYFATNLYSGPLTCIVLRELYQNARDACRRTDRSPRITMTVTADDRLRYGQVVCRDNGCGMDEDTILDRFLCLGETDKAGDDTGGFGIAKAVILGGCTGWEVHTRDLHVSMDHVRQGQPVDIRQRPIIGTRVALRYDPLPKHDPRYRQLRLSPWALAQALSWLAHNDSPCTLVAQVQGQERQVWRFQGLSTSPGTLVSRGGEGRTTWRLHQIPAQSVSALIGPNRVEYDVRSAGKLFVRLHGLVQFEARMGDHSDCWILDVHTEARPRDADYPFNLSRENFAESLKRTVDKALDPHKANPISSHLRQFRCDDEVDTLYLPGAWLSGNASEDTRQAQANEPSSSQPSAAGSKPSREEEARRLSVFAQKVNAIQGERSPLGYAVMVKGVDQTRRDVTAPHNLRLLATWARVLQLVVQAGRIRESFGVGFLFDADTLAERVVEPQGAFYLINPRLCELTVSRTRATLIKMFVHAGHELAHERYPNHGERHSSWMGSLLNKAAGLFAAYLNDLARELTGRKKPPLMPELQLAFTELLEEEEEV